MTDRPLFLLYFLIIPAATTAQSIAVDHFEGITLDAPLASTLATGEEMTFAGAVHDLAETGLTLFFLPDGDGDLQASLDYFIPVDGGRFSHTIIFDHLFAGTYTLAVSLAATMSDDTAAPEREFHPFVVVPGKSAIDRMPRGLGMDQPLPESVPAGGSILFAGIVSDPTVQLVDVYVESFDAGDLRDFFAVNAAPGNSAERVFELPIHFSIDDAGLYTFSVVVQRFDSVWESRGNWALQVTESGGERRRFGIEPAATY